MDVMIEGRNSGMDGDFGAEEEELDLNLFHFWDFPPENVSSDDFVGDCGDSGLERLEPTGLDALMSPTIQRRKIATFPMDAHIDEKPKQLPDYVGIASGSCILDQNVSTETRESGALQTQSPDSAVGISTWCSTGTFGAIPVQPRSRTTRPHLKPWNPMSPWHPTKPSSGSTSNYRKHKERKRLLGNAVYGLQSSDLCSNQTTLYCSLVELESALIAKLQKPHNGEGGRWGQRHCAMLVVFGTDRDVCSRSIDLQQALHLFQIFIQVPTRKSWR